MPAIRQLFTEYANSLDLNLCFQGFKEELAGLPGRYAPPEGRLLLARVGGEPAGCVALRKIEPAVCEMKRLYARPAFRGIGLGRKLACAILAEAQKIGYERMVLDTLASMKEAIGLYESLGFRRTEAYYQNPSPCAVFMALDITHHASRWLSNPAPSTARSRGHRSG